MSRVPPTMRGADDPDVPDLEVTVIYNTRWVACLLTSGEEQKPDVPDLEVAEKVLQMRDLVVRAEGVGVHGEVQEGARGGYGGGGGAGAVVAVTAASFRGGIEVPGGHGVHGVILQGTVSYC